MSDPPITQNININTRGRSNNVNYAPNHGFYDSRSININGPYPRGSGIGDQWNSEFMGSPPSFAQQSRHDWTSGSGRYNQRHSTPVIGGQRPQSLIPNRITLPPNTYPQNNFGIQSPQHGRGMSESMSYSRVHNTQPPPRIVTTLPSNISSVASPIDTNSTPAPIPVDRPTVSVPSTNYLVQSPTETPSTQILQTEIVKGSPSLHEGTSPVPASDPPMAAQTPMTLDGAGPTSVPNLSSSSPSPSDSQSANVPLSGTAVLNNTKKKWQWPLKFKNLFKKKPGAEKVSAL